MRVESSVTSISWIPSEAITGATKLPFKLGVAHWDPPLPDVIDPQILTELREQDRFRFANDLRASIEVTDGVITGHAYEGTGHIGVTTLRLGPKEVVFQAVQYPVIQAEPEIREDCVRFVQTAGGRTGVPAPRPVPHPPFFQISAPSAWSTLALTLYAEGRAEYEVIGASPFPRHWVYDGAGTLAAKTGLINFKDWAKHAFGDRTPWGNEESPAIVTAVETGLERELSVAIMSAGKKPKRTKVKKGRTLVQQGDDGTEVFLLLDGILSVEADGETVAEFGPGAILGERAMLEGGKRTATLRALTPCTVAVAKGDDIDRGKLQELAEGHRLEDV